MATYEETNNQVSVNSDTLNSRKKWGIQQKFHQHLILTMQPSSLIASEVTNKISVKTIRRWLVKL